MGSASIRGDKKLLKALSKLSGRDLAELNHSALARAGTRVRDRARSGYLSGFPLRRITDELYNSVRATSLRPTEYIAIGSPLPQAMPLHFGWPAHNMRARPWLFPALDDELPKIADIWIDEMSRSVGAAA